MNLTYIPPKKIKKPLARGDVVDVCDRYLSTMSTQKVILAGKRVVVTDCGRRWDAKTGWWIGENGTWPFPSIRRTKVRRR